MCLLVIAWDSHPRYRLVVAANRDEFHERPAAPLAKWPASEGSILAGRDLRANGTWLALDQRRHFGVITNFRDLQPSRPEAPSRGGLIPDYLRGGLSAGEFLRRLEPEAPRYAGFNLLLTDADSLWYASNRAEGFARSLPPGVYGLSNEFLDTPWPKLRRVRRRFDTWLADATARASTFEGPPSAHATSGLFELLDDRLTAGVDEELPQTGIPLEWERILSAPFVLHPDYGTRASTVLLLERSGAGYVAERRFDREGKLVGESGFELETGRWV